MTEPASEQQQNHHLKTSDAPSSSSSSSSGGRRSSGASLEHPPSSGRAGSPESAARGRQSGRKVQWAKAENGTGPAVVVGNNNNKNINNSDSKLWQQTMRGGQQADVCPALTAGNSLPACPVVVAAQHCQGPAVTDASSAEGGNYLVAHGNSGDGPPEETWSRVQGDSGIHVDVDPAGGLGSGSDTAAASRRGRKKHRRRASKKKRCWKPYFNLSWEEKRAIDERETARASRVREEMFAKGLPVAPYNTTQFLMEEHDREEPDLNTETGGGGVGAAARRFLCPEDSASEGEDLMDNYEDYGEDGNGCGPGDGIGRPGNAGGGEFLQRDFSETYERYHVETLQNMSKQELVQEYLELEKCMSRLEEENNRLLRGAVEPPPGATATGSPPGLAATARVRELEGELERLRALNSDLRSQPNRAERSGTVGGH